MNDVTKLNALAPGWTEASANGLLCNPNPGGGIIDKTILTKEWFVIFGDGRQPIEGLATRAKAVQAFIEGR
jgi:hypothetical protein